MDDPYRCAAVGGRNGRGTKHDGSRNELHYSGAGDHRRRQHGPGHIAADQHRAANHSGVSGDDRNKDAKHYWRESDGDHDRGCGSVHHHRDADGSDGNGIESGGDDVRACSCNQRDRNLYAFESVSSHLDGWDSHYRNPRRGCNHGERHGFGYDSINHRRNLNQREQHQQFPERDVEHCDRHVANYDHRARRLGHCRWNHQRAFHYRRRERRHDELSAALIRGNIVGAGLWREESKG